MFADFLSKPTLATTPVNFFQRFHVETLHHILSNTIGTLWRVFNKLQQRFRKFVVLIEHPDSFQEFLEKSYRNYSRKFSRVLPRVLLRRPPRRYPYTKKTLQKFLKHSFANNSRVTNTIFFGVSNILLGISLRISFWWPFFQAILLGFVHDLFQEILPRAL